MLHTKFRENRPAGSGGHLGHVTRVILPNFHFLVPELESFHTKFNSEWPSSFLESPV